MAVDEPPPPDPPPTPKAPAGWYPDPDGNAGQRYFDGFHWTDQFYDANTKFSLKLTKNDLATTVVYTVVIVGAMAAVAFVGHKLTHSTDSASNFATHAAPPTPTAPTFSTQQIEEGVIKACEKSIKSSLKDPESARFSDDWKAWIVTHYSKPPTVSYHPENGDKLYSAGGSVNAKNSFGGYVGFTPYGCEASVTNSGYIQANAYSLEDMLDPTEQP